MRQSDIHQRALRMEAPRKLECCGAIVSDGDPVTPGAGERGNRLSRVFVVVDDERKNGGEFNRMFGLEDHK